jgi:hypothetical protein
MNVKGIKNKKQAIRFYKVMCYRFRLDRISDRELKEMSARQIARLCIDTLEKHEGEKDE